MAVLQDRHTGRVASMRNIGMIAGGFVSSQATASLLYDYDQELIWYTEGPCPEIQLFKPLRFELRQPAGQGHGEDNRVCGTAMSGRRNLFHQSYDEGEGTKSSGTATSGTHDSSRKICDQPRGTKSSGTATVSYTHLSQSASLKPTSTKSSPTKIGRFTSIPSVARRANCSSSVISGNLLLLSLIHISPL